MKPYGLAADIHLHNWDAFSSVNEDGINTRLAILISELERLAVTTKKAGGNTLILAGDLFHVRGSLAPTVLNPVLDCFRRIVDAGMDVVILAGNHDLEGKDSNRVGSAITALEGVGCKVVNSAAYGIRVMERVILIPWIHKINDLKDAIVKARDADSNPSEVDLIIHAPIDGVIPGLPAHGLEPGWLESLGFRRVFAGHYHDHKEVGKNVYSIGALAHHTWSDVGTKAGFLLVDDDVKWLKSHAPEFVEITPSTDPDDVPLIVDGSYVRIKTESSKQKDIEDVRDYLTTCGAKGVVVLQQKAAPSAGVRTGRPTVSAGASLEVSVNEFITTGAYDEKAALAIECQDILNEARSAA